MGGILAAAVAYKQGAGVVGAATTSWEAEEGSASIRVEDVSLVHLEGGLTVVGGGLRKGKKLPSFLEGPAFFWPHAMVEKGSSLGSCRCCEGAWGRLCGGSGCIPVALWRERWC